MTRELCPAACRGCQAVRHANRAIAAFLHCRQSPHGCIARHLFVGCVRRPGQRGARMRRREFVTLVGGATAWLLEPCAATAQLSDRIRRIAMLGGFAANDPEAQARVAALQQGLKELGWTESRNVSIEFRWGTGGAAQMRAFARGLIDLKPDLLFGITTPAGAAPLPGTKNNPNLFKQRSTPRPPPHPPT